MAVITKGKREITVGIEAGAPGEPAAVFIYQHTPRGCKVSSYWAEGLDADFGTAVRLTKFSSDKVEGEPDSYDVLIDAGIASCECMGFLRHGHCKHVKAAEALIEAGALRPSPRPEEAVEIPAKAAQVCYCPECRAHFTDSCFCSI